MRVNRFSDENAESRNSYPRPSVASMADYTIRLCVHVIARRGIDERAHNNR